MFGIVSDDLMSVTESMLRQSYSWMRLTRSVQLVSKVVQEVGVSAFMKSYYFHVRNSLITEGHTVSFSVFSIVAFASEWV